MRPPKVLSKAECYRKAANKYAETARQADKRVLLAKSPRLRKANPKADTPIESIDPERLSQAAATDMRFSNSIGEQAIRCGWNGPGHSPQPP
jgi:hypothetical protein